MTRDRHWPTSIALGAAALMVAGLAAGAAAAADKYPKPDPSPASAYQAHYVDVLGSKMYYVDKGEGDPIVFLHGQPTSSYLWRNVMPHLEKYGRVIAPDNIGFGRSDQPDIDYRYPTHYRYIEGFIKALDLKNITFVIHDWGSAFGFHYASENPDNVKGIAFMESIVPPVFPAASYDAMRPLLGDFFRTMRNPDIGPKMMIEQNYFVEGVLPGFTNRTLDEEAMTRYREPFLDMSQRKQINQWPNEVPIGGEPADVTAIVEKYVDWIYTTEKPLLFLYARPGALNPPEDVDWLAARARNMETAYIGMGLHYVPEDHPYAIGRAVGDWYRRNFTK